MKDRLLKALLIFLFVHFATESSYAAKRALIIGFSEYSWTKLPGVKTDLKLITTRLQDDYILTVIDDAAKTRKDFRDKWGPFVKSIQDKDDVLIYYAGHAIDFNGLNYLLPLDVPEPKADDSLLALKDQFLVLRDMVSELHERTPRSTIFVIDACRTNPYSTKLRGPIKDGGLGREVIERYSGYTLLFFSADFNQAAADSLPGKGAAAGSPFAHVFYDLYPVGKTRPIFAFTQAVSFRVQQLVAPRDQLPTSQGTVPPSYCLGECDKKAVEALQIVVTSVEGQREAIIQHPKALPQKLPQSPETLASLKTIGNVVYVGTRSQAKCEADTYSGDIPFGCEFLKKAISVANADGKTLPREISIATSKVNLRVRRGPPKIERAKGINDCEIRVLERGESIKLKSIVSYQYSGDTYLWGVVDGPAASKCP
ncbi:caspase family protein [Bradyrhizobium sp. HKCCYLRH3095]|uniref:caspase family protein n=1 Tax=Bradyrhizobium sp. HKCCYLRH3095 TaxID=3420765 RepID=UPI003EB6D614